MSIRARGTALLLACLVTCLVSLSARTALGADPAAPRVVRVFVAGSAKMVEKTRATVRELCARLDLDVVVQEGGDESLLESIPDGTFAEAFIDYRPQGAPRIVVVQVKPRRELERRTLSGAGSPEMTVEEAAHVVYAVVESSLRAREARSERQADGGPASRGAAPTPETAATEDASSAATAGATPPGPTNATPAAPSGAESGNDQKPAEPPSTTTHTDATRSEPSPAGDAERDEPARDDTRTTTLAALRADLAVFGSASMEGAFHPLPGLGATLDVGIQTGSWRIGGTLLGGSSFSSDVSASAGEATLRAEFVRAFATIDWQRSRRLALLSGLGGGVDRITIEARSAPPRIQSEGVERRVDPLISGLVGARIGLVGPVSLVAALFVDVDLTPHRFVAESASGHTALLEFGRVHACALAGLSVSLSGATDEPRGAP